MSTHKKIEWSLFILGILGLLLSVVESNLIEKVLFGVIILFAGLHVFHLYDGHKANRFVVAGSLTLVAYTTYLVFTTNTDGHLLYTSLPISALLLALSLRLRRDFHKN